MTYKKYLNFLCDIPDPNNKILYLLLAIFLFLNVPLFLLIIGICILKGHAIVEIEKNKAYCSFCELDISKTKKEKLL